jgi:hypothetical protein
MTAPSPIPIPIPLLRLRLALLCGAVLLLLGIGSGTATAQVETGSLTLRVAVTPATDPGHFDLAVDGVPLGLGLGDGGAVVLSQVVPGTFALAETAASGTTLAAYGTTIRCVDGDNVLVDTVAGTTTSVDVGAGQSVVCTFSNTLLPPPAPETPPITTVAPPITTLPVLLPPPFVRGTAVLLGPVGCVDTRTVMSRVTGRNIARVVFLRDGKVVKRLEVSSLGTQNFSLRTQLPVGDARMRTVVARVYFMLGATPRLKVLLHRFAHCGTSRVTG